MAEQPNTWPGPELDVLSDPVPLCAAGGDEQGEGVAVGPQHRPEAVR